MRPGLTSTLSQREHVFVTNVLDDKEGKRVLIGKIYRLSDSKYYTFYYDVTRDEFRFVWQVNPKSEGHVYLTHAIEAIKREHAENTDKAKGKSINAE